MPEVPDPKSLAEAAERLARAVPVYQDVVQPAARQVGHALETVAKTVHIVLAPVAALVWGFEELRDFLSTTVAAKLRTIPQERIQEPPIHVVGPALEALRYAGQDSTLRDMYANLLATALDRETVQDAHPAFVEILRAMTPDEARIMRLFSTNSDWPAVDLVAVDRDEPGTTLMVIRTFSLIGYEAGCQCPDLTPSYLDNLARLGLIESPEGHWLTGKGIYEPLIHHQDLAADLEAIKGDPGQVPNFHNRFFRLTNFGRQFCAACILAKNTVSVT